MLTISFGARPQQDRDKASVGDHLYSSDGCDDLAPIAALIAYRLLQMVRNHRLRSSFRPRASFPRYLRGQNVARRNSFGARVDIVRASKREDYNLCERQEQIKDDVRRMWQETEKAGNRQVTHLKVVR